MKKLFLYAAIIAALFGITTSCSDFLEVDTVGTVDSNALLTESGIDYTITGMYSLLYGYDQDDGGTAYFYATVSNYTYGDVLAGDANKGATYTVQSDFTNLETYSIVTDNSYMLGKWESVYEGVYRANNLILQANEIQDELAAIEGEVSDYYTETIAQARFFRGFWLFEGIKVFGAAIPYVDENDAAGSVNPSVSNVDDSGNYIYIWDDVAEDLEYAYENLPETWSSDLGRVNKWAAAAMLAKLRLYQSSPYNGTNGTEDHWSDAKTLLEEIIASGVDNEGTKYCLADTYETLWVAGESDWTGESVFDVQNVISGTQYYTNCIDGPYHTAPPGAMGTSGWGYFQPSYELMNAHIVDEDGLPLLDKSYREMDPLTTVNENNIPTTDLTVYTDPRIDVNAGRFNTPYWDWAVLSSMDGWVRDFSNGGPYLNKKRQPKSSDQGSLSVSTITSSSAKNFHIIRYADVLLWYAEVLIHYGEYQEAGNYINEVRARAANGYVKALDSSTLTETTSDYVLDDLVNGVTGINAAANYRIGLYPSSQFATEEGATEALRFERRIELAMEGHRWFDLARWGIVADWVDEYIDYEKNYISKFSGCVYNDNWVTLPIPNDEIVTMEGVLVQNENWK